MSKLVASVCLCSLYAGCSAKSWQHTAPHNTPYAWEFNAPQLVTYNDNFPKLPYACGENKKLGEKTFIRHSEGLGSLYAGWKQLTAPEGMIWDELMGSYQQDLGVER